MTTTATQLRTIARGTTEWRVQHPKTGAYCWSMGGAESVNPERAANEWMQGHLAKFPDSPLREYIVAPANCQTDTDRLMLKAADELERAERRYGLLRRLSPAQFAEIWKLARSGELTFDQAVDDACAWIGDGT